MPDIAIDQEVPDFTLPATGNQNISLSDFRGKQHVVLYFYPRDNTPGCTSEGQDFTQYYEAITALDAQVLGISRDDVRSHEKFKERFAFPFHLLADTQETVCNLFGVMKMKNMYGKQVRGIERSTFIIDREGILRRSWRNVKVEGHVEEVITELAQLYVPSA